MNKPTPRKFAIWNLGHELKIFVEDQTKVETAKIEAQDFGTVRPAGLDAFHLEYRPTFNVKEVIAYLNKKFEEVL